MKNSLRMIGIAAVMWFGLSGGVANALTPGPVTFTNNTTSFDANFGNDSVTAPFIDHHTFTAVPPMFGLTGASVISGFTFPVGFNVALTSFDLWDITGVPAIVAPGVILPGGFAGVLGSAGLVSGNLYDIVVAGAPMFPGTAGSYGGNINISPIPEPETYAMLLVGLGLVGFTMRRRKSGSSRASFA